MFCPHHPGNFFGRLDLFMPNLATLVPDIPVVALGLAVIVGSLGLVVTLSPRRVRIASGSAVRLASSFLFPLALLDVLGAASGAPDQISSIVRAASGALVVGVGCGLLWLASRVGRRE